MPNCASCFALLVGLATWACTGPERSTTPLEQQPPVASVGVSPSARGILTPDDLMAAIATRAPGFAGMFWDSAGRLIIRTTPDADPSIVLTTIRDPENSRAFRGLHDALLENRFEVIPNATFDFRALMSLRDSLWFALQDGSVSSVSIDEARNTVRIGTTTQAGEDRIRDAAMRRLIPTGALAFQRGLVVRDSSIRNKFRPIPGGVQVSNSLGQCTIGANVTTEYGNGFVTASHCTSIPWQADGLDFYQPSSDLVGYEIADPTPSQLGRVCSPYVLCRLSDAAFILYDQSSWAELARIARTEGLGSTTIDSYNHRFVIADEGGWLLVGAHVNKIGRTSGWTAGEVTGVTETCVDLINWMTPPCSASGSSGLFSVL